MTVPTRSDLLEPGRHLVMRDVRGGRVRAVSAAVVVEHTADHLVTWIPDGAALMLPVDREGRLTKGEEIDRLADLRWDAFGGPLFVWPRGAWFSVRVSWDGTGTHRAVDHWYVNLHTPISRTAHGFDLADLLLDVVIQPDLLTWSWKDEADFTEAVERGAVEAEEGERARRAGLDAVALAAARAEPFVECWAAWQPDPSWSVPTTLPRHITQL